MRKILLDTNAYAAYLGGDSAVWDVIVNAGVIYLSIFVLGELDAGFKGSRREVENYK